MSTALALSPARKAAALVLLIGMERASQLLERLSRPEVERLAEEITALGTLGPEERAAVLREALEGSRHLLNGGPEAAKALLGSYKEPEPPPQPPFAFLEQVEPEQLYYFLTQEHPQTVAVVLAHLPGDFASRILAELDPELRNDVTFRIATLGRVSPDLIAQVEETLSGRLRTDASETASQRNGPKDLARILNHSDHATEQSVLAHLSKQDPKVAEQVRQLLFIFEDLTSLDDRSLQVVLRSVDIKNLALALKGASEEVTEAVMRNVSERMREDIREEMEVLGPVFRADVDDARTAVISTVRELEAAGEVTINRAGKGDLVE